MKCAGVIRLQHHCYLFEYEGLQFIREAIKLALLSLFVVQAQKVGFRFIDGSSIDYELFVASFTHGQVLIQTVSFSLVQTDY